MQIKFNFNKNSISKWRKIFLIMRLYIYLMILGLAPIHAHLYSQNTHLNIHVKNMSVRDALKQVEQASGLYFFMNDNLEVMDETVSINAEDQSFDKVMNMILKERGLSYRIYENVVVITEETVFRQGNPITGTVTDGSGETLPGVNVMLKGTSTGVVTDMNGRYTITVPDENATLVFSFVGFASQEILTGNQRVINVLLIEDAREIEEVVVVGYSTVKKINLTGSVTSIGSKELEERPQSNVQNMIQGKVAGLQIVSNTGQPGRDGGSIVLHGRGSFASSYSPLVLIDGVVGSLSNVDSENIESISILKDAASASIYGARAANGVILVTTKKGKSDKTQVSYSFNYGLQQATKLSDQIWESAGYMEIYNKMADRAMGRIKYSQEMIDRYKDPNRDKNLYPDYNWMEETFGLGSLLKHNLSVNGGNEKTTYTVSLGYLNQKGILMEHEYKRLSGLINLESQVHKRIKIGLSNNLFYSKIDEPYEVNDYLVLQIYTSRPMTKPYLPDGSGRYSYVSMPYSLGGEWANRNPYFSMKETSRIEERWNAVSQLYSIVDLIKQNKMQLVWTTKGGFNYTDVLTRAHYPENASGGGGYYYLKESDYLAGGADEHKLAFSFNTAPQVSNNDGRSIYSVIYSTLGYSWNIGDHDLSALLGYQEEAYTYRSLYGYREKYPTDTMKELNGGSTVGQSLSGSMSQYALRSAFGRLNYAFRQKYLLEANFRYDGTSRIHKDNRWGLFSSFSGGWRISEEKLIKENLSWVDNLKLRVSWGKLGNSEIGYYPYQDTYSTTSYVFNGEVEQGVYQSSLKDISLQWETTTVANAGLDLSLGNGLFFATVDWYNKVTDGILSTAVIPASVGMGAPTINYGSMQNRGIEFEVGHRNKIGEFGYSVNFMASFNENKVTKLRAPSYGNYIYEVGKPYGEHYLYIWDTDTKNGIFQSLDDIASSPKHPNSPRPGDIRFKDLVDDKAITADDRQMVRGVYPKMLYSFVFNFDYKRFDMSAFFQGVEGRKIWTHYFGQDPFGQGGPPEKKWLNAWTPDNPDSKVPAIYYSASYAPMMGLRNTYYLTDASYLRLKNLQFGYNFPKEWTGKIGIDFLRIYFSGENLLTFTKWDIFDPERAGDGFKVQYPHLKTYSLGLNLKF